MSFVVSRDPASPSDAQLLRQYVRERDDAAFGRVVGRHMRAVRHVAYRYTHHRQAAEDVAQAAFLVMAQRPRQALRSAKWKRSALPWLAKVARYAAANWRRAEERRHRHESRAAAHTPAHYDPTAGVELAEAVRSALSCLPRRDRRIVEWRHLSQMPWDEVARQAGTTPEAARKAGTRALSQLRVVLEKRGITAGGAVVLAGLRTLTAPAAVQATAMGSGMTSAPHLAKGVLVMMNLKTAGTCLAITAALVLTAGTALKAVEQDPPATTRPAGVAGAAAPFRVELPDGGAVEILYLAEHRVNGIAWTANGTQLPRKPVEIENYYEKLGMVEYVFRHVPAEGDTAYFSQGPVGGGLAALPPQPEHVYQDLNESLPEGAHISLLDPEGRDQFDLIIRVPAGAWQTAIEWTLEGQTLSRMNAFSIQGSDPIEHEIDGRRYVTITWAMANAPVGDMQIQREAVLKDGRVVEHNNSVSTNQGLAMSSSHFRDVSLDEIDRFRIRVRPLRNVTIRNIAARPKVRTEPEAEVGEPAKISGAEGDDAPSS